MWIGDPEAAHPDVHPRLFEDGTVGVGGGLDFVVAAYFFAVGEGVGEGELKGPREATLPPPAMSGVSLGIEMRVAFVIVKPVTKLQCGPEVSRKIVHHYAVGVFVVGAHSVAERAEIFLRRLIIKDEREMSYEIACLEIGRNRV